MAVYEDQKSENDKLDPDVEHLRRLTGINEEQEATMDREAHSGAAADIATREGLFNPDGDVGDVSQTASAKNSDKKADNERKSDDTAGKGWSGGLQSGQSKSRLQKVGGFLWGSKARRRATIISATTGVLGSGSIFGSMLLSGPAQYFQLGHLLQVPFEGSNTTSEMRSNNLLRWYRAFQNKDITETRLGWLGSKTFAKSVKKLSDIGIEFKRNKYTGSPREMTIDTEKLSEKYPELKGMSASETRSWLANKFDLDESQLGQLVGAGGGDTYVVKTDDMGLKALRALTKDSLMALEDGKVVTFERFRVASRMFNMPSLFHPFESLNSKALNKYGNQRAAQDEEKARQAELDKPLAEEAAPAEEAIKGKMSGIKKGAGFLLILSGTACVIHNEASSVVSFDHIAVVATSAIRATDISAGASQTEYGQGSMQQAGAVVQSVGQSVNGHTIWDAAALRALNGQKGGIDMPADYVQAYSPATTAENLQSNVDKAIGGKKIADGLCSRVGEIIQMGAGLFLLFSGFFDGGTSWTLAAARMGDAALGAVATGAAMSFLGHQISNIVGGKAIIPAILNGPLGGNILAFGARAAEGINAIASGGIALSNDTVGQLAARYEQNSQRQFQSEPFFARMFDIHDYRSFISRFSASFSPTLSQNALSLFGTISNIPSAIGKVAATMLPSVHADGQTYKWPFPEYGIPLNMLEDPNLQDPYANAGDVAQLLDNPSAAAPYVARAQACFGVNIDVKDSSGLWTIQKGTVPTGVNPNSSDYPSNCGDISDTNWRRIIMYIFDTDTMGAISCYDGDNTSCSAVGIDNP